MHHIKQFRQTFVIILIGFAVWRLLPHFTNLSTFLALKQNLDSPWLVAAIVSQTGLYLGDGWLSQLLLKIISFKINLKDTIRIASINVFAARYSPVGETGALVTMFYFYRKFGVETEGIIFLSIAWGIISIATLLGIFLISVIFLPKILLPIHLSLNNLIIAGVTLPLLIILFIKRRPLLDKFKKIFWGVSWAQPIYKFTKNWRQYRQLIIAHPYLIIQAIIASTLYHLTNITTLAFSFLAFGDLPKPPTLAFAYAVSLVSGWLTLSPGGIGASDATLILIFLHFKINPTQATAAVLIYRLIISLLPIPAALFSYLTFSKNPKIR